MLLHHFFPFLLPILGNTNYCQSRRALVDSIFHLRPLHKVNMTAGIEESNPSPVRPDSMDSNVRGDLRAIHGDGSVPPGLHELGDLPLTAGIHDPLPSKLRNGHLNLTYHGNPFFLKVIRRQNMGGSCFHLWANSQMVRPIKVPEIEISVAPTKNSFVSFIIFLLRFRRFSTPDS